MEPMERAYELIKGLEVGSIYGWKLLPVITELIKESDTNKKLADDTRIHLNESQWRCIKALSERDEWQDKYRVSCNEFMDDAVEERNRIREILATIETKLLKPGVQVSVEIYEGESLWQYVKESLDSLPELHPRDKE